MTPEQARLVIEIILQLSRNTITGEWPYEQCQYCGGHSNGYHDSQGFTHDADCVVLKIGRLRAVTPNEEHQP